MDDLPPDRLTRSLRSDVAPAEAARDLDRLRDMVEELRRQRNACEPKSNQNVRYLKYSQAVSALLWLLADSDPAGSSSS